MPFWQHLNVSLWYDTKACSPSWAGTLFKSLISQNSAGFRDLRFTWFPNPPSDLGNSIRQLSVIEDLLQQQVSFQAMEQQQFEWKNDERADEIHPPTIYPCTVEVGELF